MEHKERDDARGDQDNSARRTTQRWPGLRREGAAQPRRIVVVARFPSDVYAVFSFQSDAMPDALTG